MIKLVNSDHIPLASNACGALRNLSYGTPNNRNKLVMKQHDGVPALVRVIRSTKSTDLKEQATGVKIFRVC